MEESLHCLICHMATESYVAETKLATQTILFSLPADEGMQCQKKQDNLEYLENNSIL